MSVRFLALVSAALIAITGCVTATPVTPASADPDAAVNAASGTTYGQLFARVGADGSVDKQTAIDAFSLAIAPLPGAHPVLGDAPTLEQRKSGTFAVRWILNHFDELTPDQQAAVQVALQPGADAVQVSPEPSSIRRDRSIADVDGARDLIPAGAVADIPQDHDTYVSIARIAETLIAQKLGRPMGAPFYVWMNNENRNGTALAYARPYGVPGVGVLGCGIHINPRLGNGYSDSDIRVTVAHEVFHCFQDAIAGYRAFNGGPEWVVEGQAEFVGEDIMGPSTGVGAGWFGEYITHPHIPLPGRTYDAVGFYRRLAETGHDPWRHFDAMLSVMDDPVAAFKAADAAGDDFLYEWASSLIRRPDFGSVWDTNWFAPTQYHAKETAVTVPLDDAVAIAAPAWTNDIYSATTRADIVEIRIDGHARLHLAEGDIVDLGQRWVCVNGAHCECPSGMTYSGPDLTEADLPLDIALTGGLDGTSGTLVGHAIQDFCTPRQTPPDENPPPDSSSRGCSQNCAQTNGDPHLVTVNQYFYDFMAVGEFTLLRSPDGQIDIQVRQQPYKTHRQVSINTAVAIRAGSHRVNFTTDEADAVVATIDGAPADTSQHTTLEGIAVSRTDDGFAVDFPDGTALFVVGQHSYGLNVAVAPSASLTASGQGLLGVVTARGMNVPALPDGTTLPPAADPADFQRKLYTQFADAWRITQEASLFDYAPGTSTETFTDRTFPDLNAVVAYDGLTPEQIAAGEAACTNITIKLLHDQCVYDVGITGDTGFSAVYDLSADVVSGTPQGGTGVRVRVVNLYADENGPVPLDIYAWSDGGTAAKMTSVEYGAASELFDPGPYDDQGNKGTRISMSRAGTPLLEWAFNTVDDNVRNEAPGTAMTYVVYSGDPEGLSMSGKPPANMGVIYDVAPGSELLEQAPADKALLFFQLMTEYTHPGLTFFVGDGGHCLTYSDFPTLAQAVDSAFPNYGLVIDPGSHKLTLHRVEEGVDEFTFKCDTPPIYGPIDVDVAAGQRVHVFMYAAPSDPTLKSLVVPFVE